MSWGVQLSTDVFVSGVRKASVEDTIKKNEDSISMFEKEILMMISSNPREIVSDESRETGSVIEDLRIKAEEVFRDYRSLISQNAKLYIISEEIEKAEDC